MFSTELLPSFVFTARLVCKIYTLLVFDEVLSWQNKLLEFWLARWHLPGHDDVLDFVKSAVSWVHPGYVGPGVLRPGK